MSGEALREAAKAGDHAQLLELLKGGADPCSVDVRAGVKWAEKHGV